MKISAIVKVLLFCLLLMPEQSMAKGIYFEKISSLIREGQTALAYKSLESWFTVTSKQKPGPTQAWLRDWQDLSFQLLERCFEKNKKVANICFEQWSYDNKFLDSDSQRFIKLSKMHLVIKKIKNQPLVKSFYLQFFEVCLRLNKKKCVLEARKYLVGSGQLSDLSAIIIDLRSEKLLTKLESAQAIKKAEQLEKQVKAPFIYWLSFFLAQHYDSPSKKLGFARRSVMSVIKKVDIEFYFKLKLAQVMRLAGLPIKAMALVEKQRSQLHLVNRRYQCEYLFEDLVLQYLASKPVAISSVLACGEYLNADYRQVYLEVVRAMLSKKWKRAGIEIVKIQKSFGKKNYVVKYFTELIEPLKAIQ